MSVWCCWRIHNNHGMFGQLMVVYQSLGGWFSWATMSVIERRGRSQVLRIPDVCMLIWNWELVEYSAPDWWITSFYSAKGLQIKQCKFWIYHTSPENLEILNSINCWSSLSVGCWLLRFWIFFKIQARKQPNVTGSWHQPSHRKSSHVKH